MKIDLRRIALDIYFLRQFFISLSLLCILCSVVGMFVIELFQGALLLKDVSSLPYTDYYLVSFSEKRRIISTDDTRLGKNGLAAVTYINYFENTDDVMISKLCSADASLRHFEKDMSLSDNSSGSMPWSIVPESAFDDSFRNAERFLVKGRHIVRSDVNAALIDTELANANELDNGDSFTTQGGDVFSVVGIYQTIKLDPVVNSYLDVPNNMIYASAMPSDSKIIDTYNLYISFLFPYPASEITRFSERLTRWLGGDDQGTYSLTSVEQLNKDSSNGVSAMLKLSVCCIIIMCVTIFIAVYSFILTFYRKRQREFILYNALGKRRRDIIADFCLELTLVTIPSAVIGVSLCNIFFLKYLKEIISYFEKMVSVDTIFSTSTLSLYKSESVSAGLYNQLQANCFIKDSVLFTLFFVLITGSCLILINRASRKWSVMKMFGER